jgi:hypothetical protein
MSGKWIYVWWDEKSEREGWRIALVSTKSTGQFDHNLAYANHNIPAIVKEYGAFEEDKLIQTLKASCPEADFIIKL